MEKYYLNPKLIKSLNLDFFHIKKLNIGLVILKVNLEIFQPQEADLFTKAISVLISEGHYDFLIDFTETESLDTYTVTQIIEKITELESLGGTLRFLVTENKPVLKLSPRKLISKMQVYLNFDEALKDFNYRRN